jgi:hypothetical protein
MGSHQELLVSSARHCSRTAAAFAADEQAADCTLFTAAASHIAARSLFDEPFTYITAQHKTTPE